MIFSKCSPKSNASGHLSGELLCNSIQVILLINLKFLQTHIHLILPKTLWCRVNIVWFQHFLLLFLECCQDLYSHRCSIYNEAFLKDYQLHFHSKIHVFFLIEQSTVILKSCLTKTNMIYHNLNALLQINAVSKPKGKWDKGSSECYDLNYLLWILKSIGECFH